VHLELSAERVALLTRLLKPVADAAGADRKIAQGLLLSIGAIIRKKAAE